MGEIIAGSRVMVRIEAEAEGHDWPDGCASFADVFGDIDSPDDGFEAGTVIRVDEDGAVPIALVVWDGLADASEDADGDGMPAVWAWRVPCFALMPHGSCRSRWEQLVDPVRQIATIIGCPADADPLTDLDGLVMAVRGLAERAETVRVVTADRDALAADVGARIADAVAADRAAAGAWVRGVVTTSAERARNFIARSIEHGDHIDDDAPPLPSLRMVMLARDEAWRQVETLTTERDRRIEPVEHARAVIRAWMSAAEDSSWWVSSPTRAALLARVGADVLAEGKR